MGGLRLGVDTPMDDRAKAAIREHWVHVHERTGQPFDFAFFDREGFRYDTEPACRAVVAVRRLDPVSALAYLRLLHRRFYAESRDVTDADELTRAAVDLGFDRTAFVEGFTAQETFDVTAWDFNTARRLGVTGFPALVAQEEERAAYVTMGYQPWEDLAPVLRGWLAGEVEIR
jgi:putative protein-disulfide isomerase